VSIGSTTRRRWRDAEAAARELAARPADRRTLLLLTRLPLLREAVLERLAGLRGGASVYRGLRRLAAGGLVATVRPPVGRGHAPCLWYLTDLGLAVVARDQGVESEPLARRNRLRGDDLLALLPGLPQLMASYELLGALAASRLGQPDLLAWERPWRRRYQRPTAKAPVTAALPAYAALGWGHAAGAYLLVPDLGTIPLRLHRPTLDHLLVLRGLHGGELPTLAVATTDAGRADAWRALLEEARRARSEAPLAAVVAPWEEIRARPEVLADPATDRPRTAEQLVRRVRLRPCQPRHPDARLPRFVGDALRVPATTPHVADRLGRVALHLSASDRELLDFVGRHPFLPSEGLALVLGRSMSALRRRRDRLIARGLLRLLRPGEAVADCAELQLVEATAEGLALVAAQQGLTLAAAVRANGLTGGGPRRPLGARRKLLAHPAHTLGADEIFVRLIATARGHASAGGDDALVEWRSAAACCRRPVRPDGYGIYRHGGQLYGFFLEYDRATMSARDYREKFAAYYAYWMSGRYDRDYEGFPTILVVTTDNAAEERIARAVTAAAVGRGPTLPLLLTCRWRLEDWRNTHGLLGPIWREPWGSTRRYWLLGTVDGSSHHAEPRPPWPSGAQLSGHCGSFGTSRPGGVDPGQGPL
jgi:hypothetical protein